MEFWKLKFIFNIQYKFALYNRFHLNKLQKLWKKKQYNKKNTFRVQRIVQSAQQGSFWLQ